MELNIQEVHYYNELSKNFKVEPILCPYDDSTFAHILMSKIDKEDKIFFDCITCDTKFYPGINLVKRIKDGIKLHS